MRVNRLLFAIVAALAGCSAYKHFTPVSKTFLEDVDTEKRSENMPFQHAWMWAPEVKPGQYRSVSIPPIRTDLLPADAYLPSLSVLLPTQEAYRAKAQEVAQYFREQLIEKIRSYPGNRIEIVDQAGPGTAVLQIAFTELEFSHPAAQVGSLASPIPGTGAALSTISQAHAAFAMRIVDGESGALIATIADRRFPPIRALDLNQMTVSSAVREICANWAAEFAEALEKGRFAKVERRGVWEVLPW